MSAAVSPTFDYATAVLDLWQTNNDLNLILVEHMDEAAWRAMPPKPMRRTPASLFAHMHNCRVMWLKVVARRSKPPAKLNAERCTRAQVRSALEKSTDAIGDELRTALAKPAGRIPQFGAPLAFVNYLSWHEAHHRGQVLLLARLGGHPLPAEATYGIWLTLRKRGLNPAKQGNYLPRVDGTFVRKTARPVKKAQRDAEPGTMRGSR